MIVYNLILEGKDIIYEIAKFVTRKLYVQEVQDGEFISSKS